MGYVMHKINSEESKFLNCGKAVKKRWSVFSSQLNSTALQGSCFFVCF